MIPDHHRGWYLGMGLGLLSLLLWGSVGTTASGSPSEGAVRLVHDFFPGEFASERPLPQLTKLGNLLFFVADDLATGRSRRLSFHHRGVRVA